MTHKIALAFALTSLVAASGAEAAGFDPCQFNFGRGWKDNANLTGMNYVTIYAGDDGAWNQYWHGAMVNAAKSANVTPVFYGYITAFMARKNAGLADCDVGEPSLCTQGANYIRNHKSEILALYKTYAQNTAAIIGSNGASIWLVEPDLYQYSVSGSTQRDSWKHDGGQQGGGIPDADVAAYFKEIAAAIRTYLPNAKIAVDISPWITSPTAWYNNFDKSVIDYAFTSGGRTEAANTKIRSENTMTWLQAHNYTGKYIIADAGYGVGGGSTGHDAAWDVESNIEARIANGVISITQFNARDDWNSAVLTSLRPKLPATGLCGTSSSSSVVSSSSSKPSSSSSVPSSSSSKPSSSSSAPSSSSSIPSSSSSIVSSSSSAPSSSSTPLSSSSSGGVPVGNLVQNGDFAQGTQHWDFIVDAAQGASGSGSVTGGVYLADLNWGGNTATGLILSQDGIQLQSGAVYSLSFEAAAGEYQGGRDLSFRVVGASSEACSTKVTLTDVMTEQQCTFTAGSGPYTVQILAGGSFWQDVRIDNVILLATGAVPKLDRQVLQTAQLHARLRNGVLLAIPLPGNNPVEVFNIHGKHLESSAAGTVDLGQYPAGLYLLRVRGSGMARVLNR